MNLLLIEPDAVDPGGIVRLADPRRVGHLLRVLRVVVGDTVRTGIIDGPVGQGRVLAVEPTRVTLQLELSATLVEPPSVELVLALPRPKALRRVLRAAVELGVARLDLVNAWRVDKSYWHSPRLRPPALRQTLIEGAEQAGRSLLPPVELHPLLMPFFDEGLPQRSAAWRVIAHPRAEQPLERVVPPGGQGPVLAAIGPEGGWIAAELARFVEEGFVPVSLGPAVLRTEVAVAVLLAQLELLRRLPGPTGAA